MFSAKVYDFYLGGDMGEGGVGITVLPPTDLIEI